MTASDYDFLFEPWNLVSNDRLGITVVYKDKDVFYDAGVRLGGGGAGRGSFRHGFSIRFHRDNLFRGVHRTLTIDRSARPGTIGAGAEELIYNHIAAHSGGGLSSRYDDVAYVEAPSADKSNMATLKMARYTSVFLDSQYENGTDGHVFEYEISTYTTRTENDDPEGRKLWNWFDAHVGTPPASGTDVRDLGDDGDPYRPYFLIRNNRRADNYEPLIQFAKLLGQSSISYEQAEQSIDLDVSMRELAALSLAGAVDTYYFGNIHNMRFYFRADDGKAVLLPWDQDYNFCQPPTASLFGESGLNIHSRP